MKKAIVYLFCFLLVNANELLEEFNKYPTSVYQGKHKIPKNYQCSNEEAGT